MVLLPLIAFLLLTILSFIFIVCWNLKHKEQDFQEVPLNRDESDFHDLQQINEPIIEDDNQIVQMVERYE